MTYQICYWDSEAQEQRLRDSTPEEDVQRALDIAAATAPIVPEEIAMWQARAVMIDAGILAGVYAIFNAMASPAKEKAIAKFEYSSTMRRSDPLINYAAPALGLTQAQIDTLFIEASKL